MSTIATDKPEIARLKEIIKISKKLKWIYPIEQPNKRNFSYPLMQLSEVEKCMIAMVDNFQLERMREWEKEVEQDTKSENGQL